MSDRHLLAGRRPTLLENSRLDEWQQLRPTMLGRLTGADHLSLVALFFAWSSAILLVQGEPNWGIVVLFGAYLFDKLDGYWARRTGRSSAFGRAIDSFIDTFAYLASGALLFHVAVSPHWIASVVVGFVILCFGGLRLVRHTDEGFDTDGDVSYYHGITVVHVNVVVLGTYFLTTLTPWNGWASALVIAAVCPLMVSDYRSPKTVGAHVLVGLLGLVAVGLCLVLEYGGGA
jgi:CDP-diacylglycerol--serine O-phosphatidyltransferase